MSRWTAELPDSDQFFVKIRYGPYKGSYDCYCSLDAFRLHHPRAKVITPWWEAVTGAWVMGDDGFVGRCLKAAVWSSGRHLRKTIVVRMPWGSYPYYVRKDGTSINTMRYLDSAYKHRGMSSVASRATYRHGRHMNSRKRMFAYYWLVQEMTPVAAYMKAFKTPYLGQAEKGVKLLFQEKTSLMAMIQAHYKDIFDRQGLDDETIAGEIAKLAKDPRASKIKLEAIRLALEMRGEITGAGGIINNGTINTPIPLAPSMQGVLAPPPLAIEADAEPDMQEAVIMPADAATTPTSPPSPASVSPQTVPLESHPVQTTPSDQEETSLETRP